MQTYTFCDFKATGPHHVPNKLFEVTIIHISEVNLLRLATAYEVKNQSVVII
jgi:hypothetical protein